MTPTATSLVSQTPHSEEGSGVCPVHQPPHSEDNGARRTGREAEEFIMGDYAPCVKRRHL